VICLVLGFVFQSWAIWIVFGGMLWLILSEGIKGMTRYGNNAKYEIDHSGPSYVNYSGNYGKKVYGNKRIVAGKEVFVNVIVLLGILVVVSFVIGSILR
jgi:hypothetical protein